MRSNRYKNRGFSLTNVKCLHQLYTYTAVNVYIRTMLPADFFRRKFKVEDLPLYTLGQQTKTILWWKSPFPILYLVGYKRLDAIWIVRSTMGLRRRSGKRRTHSRTSLETSTSPPPLFQFFFSSVLFIRDKKIYNNHKNKILITIKLYGRKGLSYWSDGRYFYI